MSDPDTPFICYGEAYPIAGGRLAMDHNPFRQEKTMLKPKPKPYPRARLARDDDEPMDYTAVLAFLREKLDEDDLVKVGRMLGVEVETTGSSGSSGASDAAVRARAYDSLLDGDEATLHARHRAGAINETQLALGLRTLRGKRRTTTQALDAASSAYAEQFPHAGRLKTGY